jgi:hypothetical protein
MSFTGTAAELDAQLPDAIVSFVASHLELKNTLSHAKEEMAAAKNGRGRSEEQIEDGEESRSGQCACEEGRTERRRTGKAPSLFDLAAPVVAARGWVGVIIFCRVRLHANRSRCFHRRGYTWGYFAVLG